MARLINVRLDDERAKKARRLRERGIALSDVVREAIDARYDAAFGRAAHTSAAAIVREAFARYPDPPDLPARGYDVHDRAAARTAVRRKLRKHRGPR
jgi:hypothetical protein